MNRNRAMRLVLIAMTMMAVSTEAQLTRLVRVEIKGTPRGPVFLVANRDEHDYLIELKRIGDTPIWEGNLHDTSTVPLLSPRGTVGSLRLGDSRTGCIESHRAENGAAAFNFSDLQSGSMVYDLRVETDREMDLSYVRTMPAEAGSRNCTETNWFQGKTSFEMVDLRFSNESLGLKKGKEQSEQHENLRIQPGYKIPRPDVCGLRVNDGAVIAAQAGFSRDKLIVLQTKQKFCETPNFSSVTIDLLEQRTPKFSNISLAFTPRIR